VLEFNQLTNLISFTTFTTDLLYIVHGVSRQYTASQQLYEWLCTEQTANANTTNLHCSVRGFIRIHPTTKLVN